MGLKPGYKQTEVGVIPEEWEALQIRNVCKLINGRGFKPHEWKTSGFPIIRIQNLNGSEEFNYYSGSYDPKILVETGQLLFAWSGSRGTSFGPHIWNGGRALLNYHTWKVVVNESRVIQEFLFHALRHLTTYIEDRAHGASALVHTQKWEMETFPIAIPSDLHEQRAIAEALSDVDALIGALEQLIAKKRDLKQAAMQQLLTGQKRLPGFSGDWEAKQLRDVAEIIMGQSPDSRHYNRSGNGVPLVQGNADIEDRRSIARVWTTQITKEGHAGDLLLTVRAPVGSIGIISERCCLGRGVCSLRPRDTDTAFLFHAMVFAEPVWKVLEQGSTFTSANSMQVAAFTLTMPPSLPEQTAIAEVLSDMDAEIAALEQRRDKTRALKQGMMQELLTGKTRLVEHEAAHNEEVTAARPEPSSAFKGNHSWAFNEAVIIAVLAARFGSWQYPLTRVRYTKLAYLLHRYVEKKPEGYLKKAAGPYNPRTRYGGPERIAQERKYVVVTAAASGQYKGFVSGPRSDEALSYFEKWYGDHILQWLERFRFKKTEHLGLLATVDTLIQSQRTNPRTITADEVRSMLRDDRDWKHKINQEEFSEVNITHAIAECQAIFHSE